MRDSLNTPERGRAERVFYCAVEVALVNHLAHSIVGYRTSRGNYDDT